MSEGGGFDPRVSIEARSLINIGKQIEAEGDLLSDGLGPNREINKALVQRLVKAKEEIEKETTNKNHEKPDKLEHEENKFIKIIKKILKINDQLNDKNKDGTSKEYGINSTINLEREIMNTVNQLRSNNTIDSDNNDLRILEDMAKLTKLVAALSIRGSKTAALGTQAIHNVSGALTNGGASLDGAVSRQAFKTNTESLSKSLRYHLDQPTDAVNINTLPITEQAKEAKERANKKFVESMQAVINNEHK